MLCDHLINVGDSTDVSADAVTKVRNSWSELLATVAFLVEAKTFSSHGSKGDEIK